MITGSLFTGAGGLDMAVTEVLGGETVWCAENDRAASRVLAYRWPEIPNLGDVTQIDWSAVQPVDVLTGGFPCQDLSRAGAHAGLAGARSGLWREMCRAVEALRPSLVIIENVRELLNAKTDGSNLEYCPWCMGNIDPDRVVRALGVVLADLADVGFDAAWCGLRAADVGAPHERFRVFVLAWPVDGHAAGTRLERSAEQWIQRGQSGAECGEPAADAASERHSRIGTVGGSPPQSSDGGHRIDALGIYEPAVRRWERLTRLAPPPTETTRNGNERLSPRFTEWMLGWPDGWVCDVPGVSRNDVIAICGRGVVPQQAAEALRRLLVIMEEVRR